MSNCVNVVEGANLTFKKSDFTDEFYQLVSTATGLSNDSMKLGMEIFEEVLGTFYWFLCDNVQPTDNGEVHIDLNGGRSSHTSRDLGHTMHTLREYYVGPKRLIIIGLTDEGDGFKRVGYEGFIFMPPKES